ncbi:MAG: GGDEF domain-containing protein, partial [Alphaproteobacteria bacterium]|nr:GGDEF domain-containing protein [Alphaproteobacteria bacterium]
KEKVALVLNFPIFSNILGEWSGLPEISILLHICAVTVPACRFMMSSDPRHLGWVAMTIASFLIFVEAGHPEQVAVYATLGAVAMTISKVQLSYRMAFLDELTGIPGRRALMADIRKLGDKYIIAMGDVDHFKKFNDTYGHDIGDQVLCMVARCLSRVGGGGKAYRYGGEEFSILFPSTDLDKAHAALEEVREKLADTPFFIRSKDRPKKEKKGQEKRSKAKKSDKGKTVGVTISIGMAVKGRDHGDPMAVLKSADEALYRAKKAGRNRIST